MRQVWCADCGSEKQVGRRMVLPASVEGEPAEYERVCYGTARQPNPEERFVMINDAKFPLPPDYYICDQCGGEIRPGDQAYTWTVWTNNMEEPAAWEQEFVEEKKE